MEFDTLIIIIEFISLMVEEVKKELYKKVFKLFTHNELTKQRTFRKGKNLVELMTQFPNHGIGFKVRET